MMDIEKLIERMNNHLQSLAAYSDPELAHTLEDAATALSTLQAENAQLRAELEQKEKYYEQMVDALAATESAELEQVKRKRDAAVSWAQKYTESIDRPCAACKHNTGDYVCTAICGNCGPMGTESCKWEFDFSGELKED